VFHAPVVLTNTVSRAAAGVGYDTATGWTSRESESEEEGTVVSAYILIQTEVGKASHVTKEIGGIKGIASVDGVTGPYDVIARGGAADLDELAKAIVMPIQSVEGVTRTLTCPILQL
jgi:DNA-binding Lrp family transcriptional regulator